MGRARDMLERIRRSLLRHSSDEECEAAKCGCWVQTAEEGVAMLRNENADLEEKFLALRAAVGEPLNADWFEGVRREFAFQADRWREPDKIKQPEDWHSLVVLLASKAIAAQHCGDKDKALHHTISTGAALLHWWHAIAGKSNQTSPPPVTEAFRKGADVEAGVPSTLAGMVIGPEGREPGEKEWYELQEANRRIVELRSRPHSSAKHLTSLGAELEKKKSEAEAALIEMRREFARSDNKRSEAEAALAELRKFQPHTTCPRCGKQSCAEEGRFLRLLDLQQALADERKAAMSFAEDIKLRLGWKLSGPESQKEEASLEALELAAMNEIDRLKRLESK